MKCPYCNYKSGWDGDASKNIEGEEGDFFQISNEITMIRKSLEFYHREYDTKYLYGCPKCKKIFMD